MKYILISLSLLTGLLIYSCAKPKVLQSPSFNLTDSSPKAIALADEVVNANGGAQSWNQTDYLSWNFFGSRKHIWNKKTGDVKIDGLKQDVSIKMNIHSKKGEVWLDGDKQSHPDSLSKYLQKGYEWWVNDSYWLVLPFKLKDSGVTLKYEGKAKTQAGDDSEVLALTFKNVGVTPNNKYLVYIDDNSKLIRQWDFYTNATDESPRFQIPWNDYKTHGDILLSGDRGRMQITDIEVGNHLAELMD